MTRPQHPDLEEALRDPLWPASPLVFRLAGLLLMAALVAYPFIFTGSFYHHLMIMVFLHAIMAQSWNVIAGMSGRRDHAG